MNSKKKEKKLVNLALQGGGTHGAFTWGILERLLEEECFDFESIAATSAGSVNAVVAAQGYAKEGESGAIQALEDLWRDISKTGSLFKLPLTEPYARYYNNFCFNIFLSLSRAFSPYQFNPYNYNALRDIINRHVDFEYMHKENKIKLFLCASNVRSGKVKIFNNKDLSADAILASAALPDLFHAVNINGSYYWDGGFMGNPSLFPLYYNSKSNDIIIIHINPIRNTKIPRTSIEIMDRVNEISFNSSLIGELRAISFVNKLHDENLIKDHGKAHYKQILVHSIRDDAAMEIHGCASKYNTDWSHIQDLRYLGRAAASNWLYYNYDKVGVESSVDIRKEFLDSGL